MNINQLTEILEKKILANKLINKIEVEDKSFLHKNHKGNKEGSFHIKLKIDSKELKSKNKIESTRYIYKILEHELRNYIHSLQIEFF